MGMSPHPLAKPASNASPRSNMSPIHDASPSCSDAAESDHTVDHAPPNDSPYVKDAVLDLLYEPVDAADDDPEIPIKVTIQQPFTPFTKSQAMLVDIDSPPPGLPPRAVLKLYDRRYINDRLDTLSDVPQPWSPSRELAAIERWRAIARGEIDADAELEEPDFSEYSPGMWEDWFEELTDARFWNEHEAYKRLKHVQGGAIPRFYGTVEMKFDVEGICGEHQYVLGVIVEYLPGTPLDELDDSYRQMLRRCRQAIAPLFVAVGTFHEHGVIHRDIRAGNIMAQLDPEPKLRLYDFGHAWLWEDEYAAAETSGEPGDGQMRWSEYSLYDIYDLQWALNEANVRDSTPGSPGPWSGPEGSGLVYDAYVRTERELRWFVEVSPPAAWDENKKVDVGKHKWYRFKPEVERWKRENLRDGKREDEYWSRPRPGSPDWISQADIGDGQTSTDDKSTANQNPDSSEKADVSEMPYVAGCVLDLTYKPNDSSDTPVPIPLKAQIRA